MRELPHLYRVIASGQFDRHLQVEAEGLSPIEVAPPIEFDGPGDQWSPETLLLAAAANCFILSFKAVAEAADFHWLSIACEAKGTLDKVERQIRFTHIHHNVRLTINPGSDSAKAEALLNKAEKVCLVSNSLIAKKHLQATVIFAN
ncbi:OsmC family protein [Neptunicella sp.]|uniref:OsmC family protein n=1 Tax=Neptunicella sp. TaxID=2125986 RepID=UPI003F68ED49